MAVFDRYTLNIAQMLVALRADDQAGINLAYYNGDHWLNGDGWTGPRPQMGDVIYNATLQAIQDAFVTRGVTKELTDRHVSGVLARELDWGFTVIRPLGTTETTDTVTGQTAHDQEQPTAAEQVLIEEAEQALTEWWDNRGVPELLQRGLACALNTKRAVFRLFVPPGMRTAVLSHCAGTIWHATNRSQMSV